jgi:hypothetical protein
MASELAFRIEQAQPWPVGAPRDEFLSELRVSRGAKASAKPFRKFSGIRDIAARSIPHLLPQKTVLSETIARGCTWHLLASAR